MGEVVDSYRDQNEYPKLGLTQWSTWMTRLEGGVSPTDVDFCLHNARREEFLEIEFKPMGDGVNIPGTRGQLRALWAKAALVCVDDKGNQRQPFIVWIVEDIRNRENMIGKRDRNEQVRLTKCLKGGDKHSELVTIEELDRRISEWWYS